MKCPKCGGKLIHIKPYRQKDGRMSPDYYGHRYEFGEFLSNMKLCTYSERAK